MVVIKMIENRINECQAMEDYESYKKLAKKIMDNVNYIYTNPETETKIKNWMNELNLKINNDYLNTFLDYIEKRILYIENEFMIKHN